RLTTRSAWARARSWSVQRRCLRGRRCSPSPQASSRTMAACSPIPPSSRASTKYPRWSAPRSGHHSSRMDTRSPWTAMKARSRSSRAWGSTREDSERDAPAPARGSSYTLLVVTVSLGGILAPLNSTMLAVALPDLRRDFGIGHAEIAWLVSAYLIAMAVAQPLGGRLGDQLGRARVFRAGLVRSEERRVGKEWRGWWSSCHETKIE